MTIKIAVIGTGYVGLVSGACMADIGHEVLCIDRDLHKIADLQKGIIPIYEPGLKEIVERNVAAGRLSFASQMQEAEADAVFLAVGTPTDPKTDNADLSILFEAANEVAQKLGKKTLIVVKSTVPVGTCEKLKGIFGENADIASNPEFLREGSAIKDFMQPDRVVCGVENSQAQDLLQRIYAPLGAKIVFTSPETSELIKYAANAMLAIKVVFINELADLCEEVGADIDDLSVGIGLDSRIGEKFLKAGPGIGGSCFPKDTRALAAQAQNAGVPTKIIEALIDANESRKAKMAKKIINKIGKGKVAVFGLTFKANTDDMRESPALAIVHELERAGLHICAYDPQGMKEAKKLLPNIEYAESAEAAAENAEAVAILTEWEEFKQVDYGKLKLNKKIIFDFRNILTPPQYVGFEYISIGRKPI